MEGGGEPADLLRRVARLERQVGDLRAGRDTAAGRRTAPDTVPPAAPAPDRTPVSTPVREREGDRFWALDGLTQRVPDPGAVLFTGRVLTAEGGRYAWQATHPVSGILDGDWAGATARISALAHPVRLLLLQQVLRGVHTAADLAAHDRLGTTGQLYHHLRQLVAAGWLRAGGHGRYDVPAERVVALLVILAAAAP